MKIFKKLIRDNMPEIMAAKGTPIVTRVLADDTEFAVALENKLLEEIQELRNKENSALVQIAYIQEILDTLAKAYHVTSEDITVERKNKFDERGGFEKRLFMEEEQKAS